MITVHPRPGQKMSDLARTLIALSGGGVPARSATSGITVTEEVALAYLVQLFNPTTEDEPAGPTQVSPRLSQVVRSAETRGGITRPLPTAADDSIPRVRPRKRAGSLARIEEANHG